MVNNMKKFLITILVAVIIGACLGIYSFNKFKEDDTIPTVSINNNQVYALQVGVFDNFDNAQNLASKYGGIVLLDGTRYRVYIAIVNDTLNLIKNYYDEKNIAYYIRTIDVTKEFIDKLNDYETILKSSSKDSYDDLIKNILKEYEKLNL